jgi:3-methyladenine DNA glycosylase AlkD
MTPKSTSPSPSTALSAIKKDLSALANPSQAKILQRFFKTGKGEYAEGDKFLGIKVPLQQKVALKYWQEISPEDLETLLSSPLHEQRLTALFMLRKKYEKSKNNDEKTALVDLYLRNQKFVNNWDLVDSSAPYILGPYLLEKFCARRDNKIQKTFLMEMAGSKLLWSRRIAMMATFAFIKAGEFSIPLILTEKLIMDKEDLIQKAVGWMLREIGNRDRAIEEKFLVRHAAVMPRTMLRYAIEKFPQDLRKKYLNMKQK